MYAEMLDIQQSDNAFNQFTLEFLTLMEKANYWVTVDHLISVITNTESLKHFVDGLEDSEVKQKLLKVTDYDATYYSKIVASLLPKLKELS